MLDDGVGCCGLTQRGHAQSFVGETEVNNVPQAILGEFAELVAIVFEMRGEIQEHFLNREFQQQYHNQRQGGHPKVQLDAS